MEEIVQYLLRFMIGEFYPAELSRLIGYTSDEESFGKYKVVIKPSGFFDDGVYATPQAIPELPLKTIEGVPFIYGTPEVGRVKDTIVIQADLIASAFFLVSRYEEMIRRGERDEHGRFPGRLSLPYRAGFISRPIVDEYGRLLRRWLVESGVDIEELIWFVRRVNLTHDVDIPFYGRTWRGVGRRILQGANPIEAVRDKYAPVEKNLYYTFPKMFEIDNAVAQRLGRGRGNVVYFFKAGGKTKQDRPYYNLLHPDVRQLYRLCRENGAMIGLHCSYQAGMDVLQLKLEKENLENAYGMAITQSRHHFLSVREPEDMEALVEIGITDDYSMGHADVAGFRLGTSKPVRFINPFTRRLTPLVLHPLTVMDCTLYDTKYMNLPLHKAEKYCLNLFENVRKVNGELNVLWHNTEIVDYEKMVMYKKVLESLF